MQNSEFIYQSNLQISQIPKLHGEMKAFLIRLKNFKHHLLNGINGAINRRKFRMRRIFPHQ